MRNFLSPRHIPSVLIFFGVLSIGLHAEDFWIAATTGKIPTVETARAQSKTDASAESAQATATPSKATNTTPSKPAPDAPTASAATPTMPPVTDDEASPAELDVLKQLSARRDQLEKRAHDLDTHEALIKVAEQRVDQKIKEMESLRLTLQSLVNQISSAQQTQLDNLVKIYETMKPTDAAKIFEGLDMPVLLGVIQRMKPKSTAPILAAMVPEKAKEVTVALTKQDQLPQVK